MVSSGPANRAARSRRAARAAVHVAGQPRDTLGHALAVLAAYAQHRAVVAGEVEHAVHGPERLGREDRAPHRQCVLRHRGAVRVDLLRHGEQAVEELGRARVEQDAPAGRPQHVEHARVRRGRPGLVVALAPAQRREHHRARRREQQDVAVPGHEDGRQVLAREDPDLAVQVHAVLREVGGVHPPDQLERARTPRDAAGDQDLLAPHADDDVAPEEVAADGRGLADRRGHLGEGALDPPDRRQHLLLQPEVPLELRDHRVAPDGPPGRRVEHRVGLQAHDQVEARREDAVERPGGPLQRVPRKPREQPGQRPQDEGEEDEVREAESREHGRGHVIMGCPVAPLGGFALQARHRLPRNSGRAPPVV